MKFSLLFMALSAASAPPMPTHGLLTIENIDCISRQVSAEQAQEYFSMTAAGKELAAFDAVADKAKACQVKYDWSHIQTRNAFRIALMDGWLLQEGLIEKIEKLGDFKPFLDKFYVENVKPTGRHILQEAYLSGKVDKALTAEGYPEDKNLRELAYNYWEWRGTIWDIEDDFRNGKLRR
ncbi:MAG: hypothetical protein ABJO01_16270 [Parasphingorhabdus sp.]|uniref:hypothetical protein n=1 Tax=Parasphingorhabdus sp. TaxID=2709688 RepID=UPI0032977EDB